jgi:ankyrin repeat protein
MSRITFNDLQRAFKDSDHVELLQQALQEGFDINKKQLLSHTILIDACYYGRSQCVELLLKHGADPNIINFFGYTPLLYASNNLACIKLLIQAKADLKYKSQNWTPLMQASENGDLACVQYLLDAGMEPSDLDNRGRTASMIAREKGHLELAEFIDTYDQPVKSALEFDEY